MPTCLSAAAPLPCQGRAPHPSPTLGAAAPSKERCLTGQGEQVVGGSDPAYRLCLWHARRPGDFALGARPTVLGGHSGPVSSLALDST